MTHDNNSQGKLNWITRSALLLALLAAYLALPVQTANAQSRSIRPLVVTTAPSGACIKGDVPQYSINSTSVSTAHYACLGPFTGTPEINGTWAAISGGSGSPGGSSGQAQMNLSGAFAGVPNSTAFDYFLSDVGIPLDYADGTRWSVLDGNNLPYFVVLNNDDGSHWVIHCTLADCSTYTKVQFATSTWYDAFYPTAIAPNGFLSFIYQQNTPYTLHFVVCGDAECNPSNATDNVLSGTDGTYNNSFYWGTDNKARVTWQAYTDHRFIAYAVCADVACSSFSTTNNIDPMDGSNWEPDDIALNPATGFPAIIADGGPTTPGLIFCGDDACASWSIANNLTSVDGGVNYQGGILTGQDGVLRVFFETAGSSPHNFAVAQCTDPTCGTLTSSIITHLGTSNPGGTAGSIVGNQVYVGQTTGWGQVPAYTTAYSCNTDCSSVTPLWTVSTQSNFMYGVAIVGDATRGFVITANQGTGMLQRQYALSSQFINGTRIDAFPNDATKLLSGAGTFIPDPIAFSTPDNNLYVETIAIPSSPVNYSCWDLNQKGIGATLGYDIHTIWINPGMTCQNDYSAHWGTGHQPLPGVAQYVTDGSTTYTFARWISPFTGNNYNYAGYYAPKIGPASSGQNQQSQGIFWEAAIWNGSEEQNMYAHSWLRPVSNSDNAATQFIVTLQPSGDPNCPRGPGMWLDSNTGALGFGVTPGTACTPTNYGSGKFDPSGVTQPQTYMVPDQSGIVTLKTSAPANAGSACVQGAWAVDTSFIYLCRATNTWVRASVATW